MICIQENHKVITRDNSGVKPRARDIDFRSSAEGARINRLHNRNKNTHRVLNIRSRHEQVGERLRK